MKPEKQPKNYRRGVFLAISVAFTGISLYNGYGFYESMYGAYIAGLISVSIEISSLAFFYHVLYTPFRRSHVIIIILIIIVRLWCGLINYSAFAHDVQKEIYKSTFEMYSKIQKVLPQYERYISGQIEVEEKENKKNYFIHARMRDTTAIDRIIEERRAAIAALRKELQIIYSITPQNIAEHRAEIAAMGAKTGESIIFDIGAVSNNEAALKSIFDIKPETANMIVGAFVSFLVEIMILTGVLMGYISKVQKYSESVQDEKEKVQPAGVQGEPLKKSTIGGNGNGKSTIRESTRRRWLEYFQKHGEWKDRRLINAGLRKVYDEFVAEHEKEKA